MKQIKLLIFFSFFFQYSFIFADSKSVMGEELKLPGKKGVCFTLRSPGKKGSVNVNMPKVKLLNAYWNYSWHHQRVEQQPENLEFIPMVWGAWKVEDLEQDLNKYVLPHIKSGKTKRLLAFNEPDKRNQANMPYQKAIEFWPILEKLNIPLVSPGCANTEGIDDKSSQGVKGTWMRDFMREADKRKYRVDYIAAHWYGGCDPEVFKSKMRRIYEKYGKRPIIITEFAVADWKARKVSKNRFPKEKVLHFMKDVIPWIEKQCWIVGYSWFSFRINEACGTSSALFDLKGNLTACGRYYRSVSKDNPDGDQTIK